MADPQRAAGPLSRWRGPHLAPRTSLNRPTGPDRGITTFDIALPAVRSAARRAEATVNDVLLVAVSQAVAAELDRRGEHPDQLRVWGPVATAPSVPRAAPGGIGNALGVMLVPVDLRTPLPERLAEVSADTTRRKLTARHPASMRAAHLVSQASGRLGLAWVLNQHQRIGSTSLSTMRGPAHDLQLAGHPIRRIIPAASRAANVAVSFLALSYAGTLTISIVHDPAQLPDPAPLLADLATTLEDLTRDPGTEAHASPQSSAARAGVVGVEPAEQVLGHGDPAAGQGCGGAVALRASERACAREPAGQAVEQARARRRGIVKTCGWACHAAPDLMRCRSEPVGPCSLIPVGLADAM